MKNIFKIVILALITVVSITACSPQESDDHSLGTFPREDQLAFAATPTAAKPNVIELKNESKVSGTAIWNFGNGITGKGQTAKAEYPFKGEYTISMTLYTTGGSTTISKVVTITDDDTSLLNTPMYNALTGGSTSIAGKTWVFDQYKAEHFGVFPSAVGSWDPWNASPDEKLASSLYTQEFTFIQTGVKLIWKNNGHVYTNSAGVSALAALGYPNAVAPPAGDFDVEYAPKAEYTFSLSETDKVIVLNGGAFFGHYAGTSTYKIVKLTKDVLELTCASALEAGNNWRYRFVPKENNLKPDIPLKGVELKEDFEKEKSSIVFKAEDMGEDFSQYYSNPSIVTANSSKKVCLYQKTKAKYSNISYTVSGYKFKLSEVNKVRMKVYIPSDNDYSTTLQPKVSVKLQDSGKGANAWQNQVEETKTGLEKGKWLELEFDFSSASARTDLDRIVIQFGDEGHDVSGNFYFDDFTFSK